jgi:hypothetical protein
MLGEQTRTNAVHDERGVALGECHERLESCHRVLREGCPRGLDESFRVLQCGGHALGVEHLDPFECRLHAGGIEVE